MENEIIILDENDLKNKIYTIRGVQVMLDSDLAQIYGYETKRFNEQVKNNIERFDEDFRFQLTDDEVKIVSRSKISTLNDEPQGRGHNIKYNPLYVVSPVKKKKQERSFGNLPTLIFLDNEHVHPVRSMDSPKFFLSNVEHNTLFLKVAK